MNLAKQAKRHGFLEPRWRNPDVKVPLPRPEPGWRNPDVESRPLNLLEKTGELFELALDVGGKVLCQDLRKLLIGRDEASLRNIASRLHAQDSNAARFSEA